MFTGIGAGVIDIFGFLFLRPTLILHLSYAFYRCTVVSVLPIGG